MDAISGGHSHSEHVSCFGISRAREFFVAGQLIGFIVSVEVNHCNAIL